MVNNKYVVGAVSLRIKRECPADRKQTDVATTYARCAKVANISPFDHVYSSYLTPLH